MQPAPEDRASLVSFYDDHALVSLRDEHDTMLDLSPVSAQVSVRGPTDRATIENFLGLYPWQEAHFHIRGPRREYIDFRARRTVLGTHRNFHYQTQLDQQRSPGLDALTKLVGQMMHLQRSSHGKARRDFGNANEVLSALIRGGLALGRFSYRQSFSVRDDGVEIRSVHAGLKGEGAQVRYSLRLANALPHTQVFDLYTVYDVWSLLTGDAAETSLIPHPSSAESR